MTYENSFVFPEADLVKLLYKYFNLREFDYRPTNTVLWHAKLGYEKKELGIAYNLLE